MYTQITESNVEQLPTRVICYSESSNFITTLFTCSLMCLWTFCILQIQMSNDEHFEKKTTNFCLHIFEEKFKVEHVLFVGYSCFTPHVYTWKRQVHQISEYFLRGNEEAARFPVHVWLHPATAKFISIWAGDFVRRNDLNTQGKLYVKRSVLLKIDLFGFRDRALYGIGLEPLLVDPLLLEPIHVNTSVLGYEVISS